MSVKSLNPYADLFVPQESNESINTFTPICAPIPDPRTQFLAHCIYNAVILYSMTLFENPNTVQSYSDVEDTQFCLNVVQSGTQTEEEKVVSTTMISTCQTKNKIEEVKIEKPKKEEPKIQEKTKIIEKPRKLSHPQIVYFKMESKKKNRRKY